MRQKSRNFNLESAAASSVVGQGIQEPPIFTDRIELEFIDEQEGVETKRQKFEKAYE